MVRASANDIVITTKNDDRQDDGRDGDAFSSFGVFLAPAILRKQKRNLGSIKSRC